MPCATASHQKLLFGSKEQALCLDFTLVLSDFLRVVINSDFATRGRVGLGAGLLPTLLLRTRSGARLAISTRRGERSEGVNFSPMRVDMGAAKIGFRQHCARLSNVCCQSKVWP